ncbi:hypothetical protein K9M50_01420 [Patescibacteria group bacterium]|nr:hypothetical protein [Patescibacteria group bacterium]
MFPNFFKKEPLPKELNSTFVNIIEHLNSCNNKEEALKEAYNIIATRFKSSRFKLFIRVKRGFMKNPEKMWQKKFLYCYQDNYLLRLFLVKSKWFKDEDIKLKFSFVYYIIPHQYLKIKIDDNQYMNVDPWGRDYGVKLGDYLYGFH